MWFLPRKASFHFSFFIFNFHGDEGIAAPVRGYQQGDASPQLLLHSYIKLVHPFSTHILAK